MSYNDKDDLFKFSGQGILTRIDRFESKNGKTILTLVFETNGDYPQTIPIKVFGRMAERAKDWNPGDLLRVEGRLGGREWNGKVFGDNTASFVEVLAKSGDKPAEKQELPPPEDLPF